MYLTTFRTGDKQPSGSTPYNPNYMIGDCKGLTGEDLDGTEIDAAYITGEPIEGIGIWFNPEPEEGKEGTNRGFYDYFNALGIEFEKLESGGIDLKFPEEKEYYGIPVTGTIEVQERNGKPRRVVTNVVLREGERLSYDDFVADKLADGDMF